MFERGQVVRVPCPYTDRSTRQRRPALVISAGAIGAERALLWVLMITSAENWGWPGDVDLTHLGASTGLPAPSVVRTAKIAAIQARDAEPIGQLPRAALAQVEAEIRNALGIS